MNRNATEVTAAKAPALVIAVQSSTAQAGWVSDSADVPVLRETPGGWLAVSPGDFPRIGVMAPTSAEAETEYRTLRQTWRRWRDLPEPEVTANG